MLLVPKTLLKQTTWTSVLYTSKMMLLMSPQQIYIWCHQHHHKKFLSSADLNWWSIISTAHEAVLICTRGLHIDNMDVNKVIPHWALLVECATCWERALPWGQNTDYFHNFTWCDYPTLRGFLILYTWKMVLYNKSTIINWIVKE